MTSYTAEQHTNALAQMLPNDKTFDAKNREGSNLRNLLSGLSPSHKRLADAISLFEQEYIPGETTLFLDEWERALAIPDGCFTGTGSNADRNTAILTKLASSGIQTAQDYIDLAAIFGVTLNAEPGLNYYPSLISNLKKARYTVVITLLSGASNGFVYDFEFSFGSANEAVIRCLFDTLKSANTQLIYVA